MRCEQALDALLQTAGSDEEWAVVFRADGMALLRYLTCFLAPRYAMRWLSALKMP